MFSQNDNLQRRTLRQKLISVLSATLLSSVFAPVSVAADGALESSTPLPDLSGLAWMTDDLFVVVHDAKNPDELGRPRVSLMALPTSLEGVLWRSADPTFPQQTSNDLESASRLPGTAHVLLVESADDGGPFDRIFLAELRERKVEIVSETNWSAFTTTYNVEATAVAPGENGEMIFIWAERNSGAVSTTIKWTSLSVDPFRIGRDPVSSLAFELPRTAYAADGTPLYDRPLVAMDVDSLGQVYIAATLDPEGVSSMADNGPFRSVIYKIGSTKGGRLVLDTIPETIGVLDGLKVESLAVREYDGKSELYIGTDDENYGGILRVMPEEGRVR